MKTIIITGISKGLGEALFDILIKRIEYNIIGVSRRFLDKQIKISENQSNIHLIKTDLSNIDEIDRLLKSLNRFNQKDINEFFFINNAGLVTPIGQIGTLSNEEIIKSINVNITAPLLISNHLVSFHKKIIIINVSSGAAKRPINGWSIYCATKAAAKMFFDVMEMQDGLVKIIQIDPGVMDTSMQADIRNSTEKDFPDIRTFQVLKQENKLKSPESVAKSILQTIDI